MKTKQTAIFANFYTGPKNQSSSRKIVEKDADHCCSFSGMWNWPIKDNQKPLGKRSHRCDRKTKTILITLIYCNHSPHPVFICPKSEWSSFCPVFNKPLLRSLPAWTNVIKKTLDKYRKWWVRTLLITSQCPLNSIRLTNCCLTVACLIEKKNSRKTKKPWPDTSNKEEPNQTVVLELRGKRKRWRSENAKPFVCVMLNYFQCSRDLTFSKKTIRMWVMEYSLTRQSSAKQERREKFNKPTTQESSSPIGGECEICVIVFFCKCFLNFNCQLILVKLKGTR